MGSISRVQLENWLKGIDVSGRVLDIGGSQNPVKGRTGLWKEDTKYAIMDLEYPHELKQKPDVIGDIQSFPTEKLEAMKYKFDTIFCLEVAEYWHDPATAMKNIGALLRQGGKAYVSFHWLYGLHNPEWADCLRYTYGAIEKLGNMAGLMIEDCQVKTISEDAKKRLQAFYLNEGMRARYKDQALYDEGHLITFVKI